jgi:hypothetical protein
MTYTFENRPTYFNSAREAAYELSNAMLSDNFPINDTNHLGFSVAMENGAGWVARYIQVKTCFVRFLVKN